MKPIYMQVCVCVQILCFGAVLTDTGQREDAPPSRHQVPRQVKIYYHLEDDTIRVIETPTHNAGTVQGKSEALEFIYYLFIPT